MYGVSFDGCLNFLSPWEFDIYLHGGCVVGFVFLWFVFASLFLVYGGM